MSEGDEILAWLEQSNGARVPLAGTCSIGRLSSNSIMIADERVSRRHALVNIQGRSEFWLVDLGSGNGTYLNGRRVAQPTRLRDGDKIEIAVYSFLFHQSKLPDAPVTEATSTTGGQKTIQQIHSTDCWLLVADIEDSTQLMHRHADSGEPPSTGKWLEECKHLIESSGGSVNKFLGDGFFAYWRQRPGAEEGVARALEELGRMRESGNLPFRVVLHFGQVFTGGGGSMGEENLQGREVHFVFRMEKLAGGLGERCLISAAAKGQLLGRLRLTEVGAHPLPGFDGEHLFFEGTFGA
jgi:pSer/pThr/pTyr-binding forkhead associated (FHA) protein